MAKKLKTQPRIPGQPKIYTGGGLPKPLRKMVERESRQFGVSKSWVVATAVAKMLQFDLISYYDGVTRRRKARVLKMVKVS